ncbi:hypothetical protein PENANT_c013G00093 [Penicillium antarcticum]|uniref:TauD/TfdA-like domain-containing protein n=1 Tax=Penicillium antarcticum TaxID=416450 RepID=A0A1V6Q546_9EURO|nr:hypothetical protein PENANT_c013G00093 [Penicillium antarcticum]
MSASAIAPDISHEPDFETYQNRTKRRLACEDTSQPLPDGFPLQLRSDLAWAVSDLPLAGSGDEPWVYNLTVMELEEIDQALAYFKGFVLISPQLYLQKPLGYIQPETFPLPTLHSRLRSLSHDLQFKRGFCVLRRLPVEKWTREENIIVYAGVSSHIGSIRGRQDITHEGAPADVMLCHITNLITTGNQKALGAPAFTMDRQIFHTDTGDVVSLLALSEAVEGGESQVVSGWTVYNEIAQSRPDLIRTLAEEWIIDGFKDAERPYFQRPLLYYQPATDEAPERVAFQFARRTFTGFGALPRSAHIPPITEAQAEALDALHFLAEKHCLEFKIKKGDIQYINNLSIIHARRGYKDDEQEPRHLLRLWLRDPEHAWITPEPLQERWQGIYHGITAEKEVFPLQPFIRTASNGTATKDGI